MNLFRSLSCSIVLTLTVFLGLQNAFAQPSDSSAQLNLLRIQAEAARTLDFFNLQTSKSYVDCFCAVYSDKSPSISRHCQSRNKVIQHRADKINTQGKTFDERSTCEVAVADLYKQTLDVHHRSRLRIALIQGNKSLQASKYSTRVEIPSNFQNQPELVVETAPKSVVDIPEPWNQLEPLTEREISEAIGHFAKEADRIRQHFLQSSTYKSSFGKLNLNLEVVHAYLKGESQALRADFEQAVIQSVPYNPWLSISTLDIQFSRFTREERIRWTEAHFKKLISDIDMNPMLLYLPQANPTEEDFLESLLQVERNAQERYGRALLAEQKFLEASSNAPHRLTQRLIHQYAFLLDHELAREYLPNIASGAYGWESSALQVNLENLSAIRSRQIRDEKITEVAASLGVMAICFVPIPHLKLVSAAVVAIKTNACLMGVGLATNTYFLVHSRSKQKRFLSELISTADGWNQLTKLNKVLDQEAESRMHLWFNLLEGIPAYNIVKTMRVLH